LSSFLNRHSYGKEHTEVSELGLIYGELVRLWRLQPSVKLHRGGKSLLTENAEGIYIMIFIDLLLTSMLKWLLKGKEAKAILKKEKNAKI